MIVREGGASRVGFLAVGALVMLDPNPALFFLPGILAVYASRNLECRRLMQRPYVSLGVIAVALALPKLTNNGFSYEALMLTTLLFVPIACGNSLFGILNFRGLRLMGLISYSVYLLHGTCLYLAQPLLARAKQDLARGAWWYWSCVAGCAVATLALSMLTYRWIEWPFIRMERLMRKAPMTADLVVHSTDPARIG